MLLCVYLATPQQQPQYWEILTHSQGNGVGLEVEIAELVYPYLGMKSFTRLPQTHVTGPTLDLVIFMRIRYL